MGHGLDDDGTTRGLLQPPRFSRTKTSSKADRNFDRSFLPNGGGPPIFSLPMPARKSAIIARVATAVPIESAVNGLPLGASTCAPSLMQRSASNISAVMITQQVEARS